jgi:hypothetical protein
MSGDYPRGEVIKIKKLEKGATNITAAMKIPSTDQPGQQTLLQRSEFSVDTRKTCE